MPNASAQAPKNAGVDFALAKDVTAFFDRSEAACYALIALNLFMRSKTLAKY